VDQFHPTGRERAGWQAAGYCSESEVLQREIGTRLACPITSKAKGYAFEVVLPEGLAVSGVILIDQLKSVDWQARGIEIVGQVPSLTVRQAKAKIKALLAL
jgi:mRNA interferase MazF